MNKIQLIPLTKPIHKDVQLPGSLSYTIRAMALAAMTKGTVTIHNPLKSDDTYAMLGALQTLGIKCEEEINSFIIYGDIGGVRDQAYEINIRLSGRTARILLAMLCIVPGVKTLTCAESFKRRPMGGLVDGLRQLGADIEYLEIDNSLPVKVKSGKLNPGIVKMHGDVSSQYFSAIMMIAPLVGEMKIEVIGEQASKPFIDITTDIMEKFNVFVRNDNYRTYIIPVSQTYERTTYTIEPDATAASYFWGIAAVTQSMIKVLNITPESKQGDVQFIELLEKMGCSVISSDDGIAVQGNAKLNSIEVNMNHLPDVVPTLAVIAAFADGKTTITGLDHLKGKESDRIEAPKEELLKMGVTVTTTENSLTVQGTRPHAAMIQTHNDHRIAMAFAVAGATTPGIVITNPEVVEKSFPEFWATLEELGVTIKETV